MGSSGLWACLNWTVYAERVRDQCNLQWRFGNRAGVWGNRVREVLKEAGCLEKSPGWKRLCWTWCVEWTPGLGGAGLGGG